VRVKRKLHAIGGGRGMWSLPIRQRVNDPFEVNHDTVVLSTDVNPSPGLSRVCLSLFFATFSVLTLILISRLETARRVNKR
jgi:cleavage and polyadenylation specificity factor subunit 1